MKAARDYRAAPQVAMSAGYLFASMRIHIYSMAEVAIEKGRQTIIDNRCCVKNLKNLASCVNAGPLKVVLLSIVVFIKKFSQFHIKYPVIIKEIPGGEIRIFKVMY